MKNLKKIMIIMLISLSSVIKAKNVFTDSYRINNGKVEILSLDITGSDSFEMKRVSNWASEITESGDFRITDKGRRSLSVTLSNGLINGRYSEYYANGNLWTSGKYNDGKREGEWKIYAEDGKIWKLYNYKNDLLNGEHINYHIKTSTLETKGKYLNGEKDGLWESFYLSGVKRESGTYKDGLKNGIFTEWYESGRKKSEINYVDDMMFGKMKVYYETGNLFYELNMNDRDGDVKGYYRNGNLSFEGKMKNGKRTGMWSFYDSSGNLYTKRDY